MYFYQFLSRTVACRIKMSTRSLGVSRSVLGLFKISDAYIRCNNVTIIRIKSITVRPLMLITSHCYFYHEARTPFKSTANARRHAGNSASSRSGSPAAAFGIRSCSHVTVLSVTHNYFHWEPEEIWRHYQCGARARPDSVPSVCQSHLLNCILQCLSVGSLKVEPV